MIKKVLAALLVTGTSVWAYSPVDSNEAETLIGDQTQVNTVVNNPISTFSTLQSSKKSRSLASDVIVAGDVKLINVPYANRLSEKWGVTVNLPYIQTTGTAYSTGIGDASVGLSYLDAKDTSDMSAAEIRLKLATGDYNLGLGTGANSLFASYTMSKQQGSYLILGTASLTLNSLFTVSSSTFGTDVTYGDVLSLSIGASRSSFFSEKVITTARLTYLNAAEDKTTAAGFNNATTNIDIWLDWSSKKLVEDVPVKWGVKIPVQASSNVAAVEEKVILFYASATGFFDKK